MHVCRLQLDDQKPFSKRQFENKLKYTNFYRIAECYFGRYFDKLKNRILSKIALACYHESSLQGSVKIAIRVDA